MSKLVVLRRCATIEEALIIDSLLQDGGFLSSTPVRYHAQNEWWSVQAFNGIPVFIPDVELVEAAEYLIEMRATAKERLEEQFGEIDNSKLPLRWRRGATMLFLQLGGGIFLFFPLLYLLAALPIDWMALAQSRNSSDIFFSNLYVGYETQPAPPGGGVLFIAFILVCLIFDVTDVMNKKHIEDRKRSEEETPK